MGFLHWRFWDRLDSLDRRLGIQPFGYRNPRNARFASGIACGTLLALSGVSFLEGSWGRGFVELLLALILISATHVAGVRSRRQDGGDRDLRR